CRCGSNNRRRFRRWVARWSWRLFLTERAGRPALIARRGGLVASALGEQRKSEERFVVMRVEVNRLLKARLGLFGITYRLPNHPKKKERLSTRAILAEAAFAKRGRLVVAPKSGLRRGLFEQIQCGRGDRRCHLRRRTMRRARPRR